MGSVGERASQIMLAQLNGLPASLESPDPPLRAPSSARCHRQEAPGRDRSPQKHVWRASIIMLTADGLGDNAIQRGTGRGKSVVWCWQERFMQEGVDGLLRDKTRPPGRKPREAAVIERVVGRHESELRPTPVLEKRG